MKNDDFDSSLDDALLFGARICSQRFAEFKSELLDPGTKSQALSWTSTKLNRETCRLTTIENDRGVHRIDFHSKASATYGFSRDDRGTASEERIINDVAFLAMVPDGPGHALNRLLGPVATKF